VVGVADLLNLDGEARLAEVFGADVTEDDDAVSEVFDDAVAGGEGVVLVGLAREEGGDAGALEGLREIVDLGPPSRLVVVHHLQEGDGVEDEALGAELLDELGEFVADTGEAVRHLDGIDVDDGEIAVLDVFLEGPPLLAGALDDAFVALLQGDVGALLAVLDAVLEELEAEGGFARPGTADGDEETALGDPPLDHLVEAVNAELDARDVGLECLVGEVVAPPTPASATEAELAGVGFVAGVEAEVATSTAPASPTAAVECVGEVVLPVVAAVASSTLECVFEVVGALAVKGVGELVVTVVLTRHGAPLRALSRRPPLRSRTVADGKKVPPATSHTCAFLSGRPLGVRMRVGIVAQRGNARAAYLAADIGEMLAARDAETWYDTETADAIDVAGTPVEEFDQCDLVVSIGGDGTFLFAARGAGSTPILGVNLGEVGFLNAVSPDDAVAAVREEVERVTETGTVRAREVPRVQAEGGQEWSLTPALNEVVVQGPKRGHGQGVEMEVRVDGSLYTAGHADGLLVATPTGSTAYNMSEDGPLVQPGVPGFIVNDMCATDTMPPLVVPLDAEITVRVDGADEIVVSADGASRYHVEIPEIITLTRADEPARVAGPESDFFQALNKLE